MITDRILNHVIVALVLASIIVLEAKPIKNLLLSEPGVVAVYIQSGDTPLAEINPQLAEAFEFNGIKHGRRAFGRQINEILSEKERNPNFLRTFELAEGESYMVKQRSTDRQESHIQKIAKH